MTQFIVKINGAKADLAAEEEMQKKLEWIQQSVLDVSGNLNFKVASTVGIKKNLTTLADCVEGHKKSLNSMKNALGGAISLYEKTERDVCGYADGRVEKEVGSESVGKIYIGTETTFANTRIAEKDVAITEAMEWVRESLQELISKEPDKETLEKWMLMVTAVCGSVQNAVSIVKKLLYPIGSVVEFAVRAPEQIRDFICEKIEELERKEKEDRMNATQLIRNYTADDDPGFIEDGCVITSMANLYRRKLMYENRSDDVDRSTIRSANNGEVNMSWDIVSNRMEENFGYGMTYEYKQPRDLNGINQLLSEHPEGIMVYSKGKKDLSDPTGERFCYHAILIVGQENGRYKVVDPIDGEIKYWEECYSVSDPSGTFPGWTIEDFLQNTNRLAHISG